LNEAAGAADATREARSIGRVACGSQGGACDPSQTSDAGGTPAAQLRQEHGLLLPQGRRAIRQTFPSTARPAQSHSSTGVPGVPAARATTRAADGQTPRVGAAVLLRENAKAPVHAGRHSISEGPTPTPDDSHDGRSP